MWQMREDLRERILEDDGLVAGLGPEAAAVVRHWCEERLSELSTTAGPEVALRWTEEVVARARRVTEVAVRLSEGRDPNQLAESLGRVLPDGQAALSTLREPRPLPDRLKDVLERMEFGRGH